MDTRGRLVTADVWLNEMPETACVVSKARTAIGVSGMNVVAEKFHSFGDAATIIFVLAESHFAIHTYPERNFLAVDAFTCGDSGLPLTAVSNFIEAMDVNKSKIKLTERGV